MQVIACVLAGVLAALLLWPADARACSYARSRANPVQPRPGAEDVPLNARILLSAAHVDPDEASEYALLAMDGGAGDPVPFALERLPYASFIEGRVRLTPATPLVANAVFAVCHWVQGAPDGGFSSCPSSAHVVTFTTGAAELANPPASVQGLTFEVATHDFPDAGPNLFCSPSRRVRGIAVHVPDAGRDLLYFARAGGVGVFSAEPGTWLPAGVHTTDGKAAGILDCDGKGHVLSGHGWGVPAGATALEVWTEDVAGNASAAVTVPLQGGCTVTTGDDPPFGGGSLATGCGCRGGGAGAGAGAMSAYAAALVLARRRRSRRA